MMLALLTAPKAQAEQGVAAQAVCTPDGRLVGFRIYAPHEGVIVLKILKNPCAHLPKQQQPKPKEPKRAPVTEI